MDFDTVTGFAPEDLIVGETNRAAIEVVSRWPDWPSPVIVLAGPTGSGKSHLAAIWADRAVATKFDGHNVGEPSLPPSGAALVEDLGATGLDETGLFHLINQVRAASGTLLLTSRSFPGAWGVELADLASRLKSATTVEISEPDDALLASVITKLFADRQLSVAPHVIQFLVHRMDRSLAAAINIVDQIDKLSLEKKVKISRSLAADVLAE